MITVVPLTSTQAYEVEFGISVASYSLIVYYLSLYKYNKE